MSESKLSTATRSLYFVTLKVEGGLAKTEPTYEVFDQMEYCDEFIKTLIFGIDRFALNIFGFVILPDQIHLIANASEGNLSEKIANLKKASAKEIISHLGKRLSSLEQIKTREQKSLRRFFSQFLNSSDISFWQKEEKFIELKLKNNKKDVLPISSNLLATHLTNGKGNYMQLGADAFTKLMMETMKI